jgi:hypothetical protein
MTTASKKINWDVFPEKDSVISYFKVHPLIAFEHYIATQNHNNAVNFPRYQLFSDAAYFLTDEDSTNSIVNPEVLKIQDVHVPNYEELRSLVNDALEHYKMEITSRRLMGVTISEWLEKVSLGIKEMEHNRLPGYLTSTVCKLVPFYQFEKDIIDTANALHLKSINGPVNAHKQFNDLTFIKNVYPRTQMHKDALGYLFVTNNNHLLQVNIRDTGFRSAIDTVLKLNNNKVSLDLSFKSRIMYNSNFGYLVSDRIEGVTA